MQDYLRAASELRNRLVPSSVSKSIERVFVVKNECSSENSLIAIEKLNVKGFRFISWCWRL